MSCYPESCDFNEINLLCCFRYEVPAERVILYGQSIGTVPSVDLASKYPDVAALVSIGDILSCFGPLFCFSRIIKGINKERGFTYRGEGKKGKRSKF